MHQASESSHRKGKSQAFQQEKMPAEFKYQQVVLGALGRVTGVDAQQGVDQQQQEWWSRWQAEGKEHRWRRQSGHGLVTLPSSCHDRFASSFQEH